MTDPVQPTQQTIVLSDTQQVKASLVYKTAAGNEAPAPPLAIIPVWSTDRTDLITLQNPTSTSVQVVTTGKLGTAEVRLSLVPGAPPVAIATVVIEPGVGVRPEIAFSELTSRIPGAFV